MDLCQQSDFSAFYFFIFWRQAAGRGHWAFAGPPPGDSPDSSDVGRADELAAPFSLLFNSLLFLAPAPLALSFPFPTVGDRSPRITCPFA